MEVRLNCGTQIQTRSCMELKLKTFTETLIAGDVETWFDTRDFVVDHPSGIPTGVNKKVISRMKDEAGGKIIQELVGLRAKLFSYRIIEDLFEHKKCKGVKKNVVKKYITNDDYKNSLNRLIWMEVNY